MPKSITVPNPPTTQNRKNLKMRSSRISIPNIVINKEKEAKLGLLLILYNKLIFHCFLLNKMDFCTKY